MELASGYLHEDGLGPPTELPTGLLPHGGVEDPIGRDTGVGHPLLPTHHPDDHVWETVLRLEQWAMLDENLLRHPELLLLFCVHSITTFPKPSFLCLQSIHTLLIILNTIYYPI